MRTGDAILSGPVIGRRLNVPGHPGPAIRLYDGPGVCAGTAPRADHLSGLAVHLRPLGHSAPLGRARTTWPLTT